VEFVFKKNNQKSFLIFTKQKNYFDRKIFLFIPKKFLKIKGLLNFYLLKIHVFLKHPNQFQNSATKFSINFFFSIFQILTKNQNDLEKISTRNAFQRLWKWFCPTRGPKKRKNGLTQKIDPKRFQSHHKKRLLYDQKYQRNTVNL